MKQTLIVFVLILLAMTLPAGADQDATYNRISLSAQASTEVENDTLVAELYLEHQAKTAAEAAQVVNKAIDWVVKQAKAVDNIKVRTLEYSTNPVYTSTKAMSGLSGYARKIEGWRVSQAMRIESTDIESMSGLITKLQEQLAIRNIGYQVSKALREKTEATLIDEAIADYKTRAQQIAKGFGHERYKLVQVNINTSGGRPPVPYARGLAMEAKAAPVAIEAGTTTLQVNISGTVELE